MKSISGNLEDLSAVMLADGQWYRVSEPTLTGDRLKFAQVQGNTSMLLEVELEDVRGAAYGGVPGMPPSGFYGAPPPFASAGGY